MRSAIVGLLGVALAATAVPTTAVAAPHLESAVVVDVGAPRTVQAATTGERRLAVLVNRVRARKGLPQLRYSADISNRADPWARLLGRPRFSGRLAHDPDFFTDIRRACRVATSGAENVAARQDRAMPRRSTTARRAARGLLRQYLNSPPHRANLLDPAATHFGVATVMRTRSPGGVYVANVLRFARASSC